MRYREIATTTRQVVASRASEMLESAGIPVMVEHIEYDSDTGPEVGFRVLVPQDFSQSAWRLISGVSEDSAQVQ